MLLQNNEIFIASKVQKKIKPTIFLKIEHEIAETNSRRWEHFIIK